MPGHSIYDANSLAFRSTNGPVGTITFTGTTAVNVPNTAIRTTASKVFFQPRNISAAVLQGSSNAPYVSSVVPSSSFNIQGGSSLAFAGTEVFDYWIVNPST